MFSFFQETNYVDVELDKSRLQEWAFQPALAQLFDRFDLEVRNEMSSIFSVDFAHLVSEKHALVRGKTLDDLSLERVFNDLVREEMELLRGPTEALCGAVEAKMQHSSAFGDRNFSGLSHLG